MESTQTAHDTEAIRVFVERGDQQAKRLARPQSDIGHSRDAADGGCLHFPDHLYGARSYRLDAGAVVCFPVTFCSRLGDTSRLASARFSIQAPG